MNDNETEIHIIEFDSIFLFIFIFFSFPGTYPWGLQRGWTGPV